MSYINVDLWGQLEIYQLTGIHQNSPGSLKTSKNHRVRVETLGGGEELGKKDKCFP